MIIKLQKLIFDKNPQVKSGKIILGYVLLSSIFIYFCKELSLDRQPGFNGRREKGIRLYSGAVPAAVSSTIVFDLFLSLFRIPEREDFRKPGKPEDLP